jgi:sugar lactone lactonase YvrE
VAGGEYGFCGDGGDTLRACFNNPNGIAVDTNGNLFIADTFNHRIRKVNAATGIISTVAGSGPTGDGMGGFSGDNGPATSATLNNPIAVAVDAGGNIFISDAGNRRIRKVSAGTGFITTVAGNGMFDSGDVGDNGPATAAQIAPLGFAVDAAGNLIIADVGNNRIRKVDAAAKIITTIAGNGESGFGGDGGLATAASLNAPNAVAVDAGGNIFITDSLNYRVRRVDAKTGTISTMGGNGLARIPDENAPATASALNYPRGVVFDAAGNLFIADTGNSRIRKVDAASGVITTVAGNNLFSFSGDGGPASAADLSAPDGVAMDAAGNLFIADTSNQRIRKIDTKGIITTVAGNSQPSFQPGFSGDGDLATKALLNYPRGVAIDGAGNLFIADTENHRIRRVDAKSGIITTVAGSGDIGSAGGGFSGDNGPGTSALLKSPFAVAIDRAGNVLIADGANFRIRKLDSKGIITTVIGTGQEGFCDASQLASAISLGFPAGIAIDNAGNIFVSEPNSHRILRIDSRGSVATVAGNCDSGFSGDSGPATLATFDSPTGIAFDPAGNLFIADTNNHRIRAVHASGRTGRRQP